MDHKKALQYWNALFENRIIDGQFMECRAIKQGASKVEFFKEAEPMLTWTESFLIEGFNLYAGVNFRNGQGGKKENIVAINAFHVDLDYGNQGHKQNNGITESEARGLLKEFELQPTMIICSGGGFHAYWVLERPVTDQSMFETTEKINKGLALALRGDQGVADITRILRIPGTFNFKVPGQNRPVGIETANGPLYQFEELKRWLERQGDQSEAAISQNRLEELGFSPQSLNMIKTGELYGKPSRSERDMAVLCDGIKCGVDYATLSGIFESYPIGDKFREETNQERYLKRSYERAEEFIASNQRSIRQTRNYIKNRDAKPEIDVYELEQLIRQEYKLKFDPTTHAMYKYTGLGYAQIDALELNRLCQQLLGEDRRFFKKRMLEETRHYLEGDEQARIPGDLISKQTYLSFQNGVLNLGSLEFCQHTPEIFTKSILPYAYDPQAECPRFQQFLMEVFEGDEERIQFTQEALGYVLYPQLPVPGLFFLYGEGANGKSVLLSTLESLVGEENYSSIHFKQMYDEKYVICLSGKMVNITNESPTSCNRDASLFKAIVSGDTVTGRANYCNPMQFRPYCKHFISINQYPEFPENTYAILRRCKIIEFNRIFSASEQDPYLREKLGEELPGILNFSLDGLKRLKGNQFRFSPLTQKIKDDGVKQFVQDRLDKGRQEEEYKDCYEAYLQFCQSEKVQHPLKKKRFRERLIELGCGVENSTSRHNVNMVRLNLQDVEDQKS